MPTPRQQAEKYNKPVGEKSYCGVCGLPGDLCDCSSYKEWGASGATHAGSADANDKMPAGGLNAPGEAEKTSNGNGNGGGAEKKPFPKFGK